MIVYSMIYLMILIMYYKYYYSFIYNWSKFKKVDFSGSGNDFYFGTERVLFSINSQNHDKESIYMIRRNFFLAPNL
jgi:hypothetical protein